MVVIAWHFSYLTTTRLQLLYSAIQRCRCASSMEPNERKAKIWIHLFMAWAFNSWRTLICEHFSRVVFVYFFFLAKRRIHAGTLAPSAQLACDILVKEQIESKCLTRNSTRFFHLTGTLYRRSFNENRIGRASENSLNCWPSANSFRCCCFHFSSYNVVSLECIRLPFFTGLLCCLARNAIGVCCW